MKVIPPLYLEAPVLPPRNMSFQEVAGTGHFTRIGAHMMFAELTKRQIELYEALEISPPTSL